MNDDDDDDLKDQKRDKHQGQNQVESRGNEWKKRKNDLMESSHKDKEQNEQKRLKREEEDIDDDSETKQTRSNREEKKFPLQNEINDDE